MYGNLWYKKNCETIPNRESKKYKRFLLWAELAKNLSKFTERVTHILVQMIFNSIQNN